MGRWILINRKITEVFDGDKFLICLCPSGKTRGMLWEFVGGKLKPGEMKHQVLIRECEEELEKIEGSAMR